jgi:hypothetical protein
MPGASTNSLRARFVTTLLQYRSAIISHLSAITLFLGFHTTVLVLLKAALNGRSSKLMPDKGAFGYGFPCDGPGRGGTCDISAWDGFYLAAGW